MLRLPLAWLQDVYLGREAVAQIESSKALAIWDDENLEITVRGIML